MRPATYLVTMLHASAAQYCSYYSPQHKQRVSQQISVCCKKWVLATFCRNLQRGSCARVKCEGVINRSILNDTVLFTDLSNTFLHFLCKRLHSAPQLFSFKRLRLNSICFSSIKKRNTRFLDIQMKVNVSLVGSNVIPSFHPSILPSIHPSIHPSFHLSTIRPYTYIHPYVSIYIHPSIHPTIHSLTILSTYPSIHPLSHLSIYPPIHPLTHLSTHLLTYPSIHPHIHWPTYPHTYLSIHPYTHPHIHWPTYPPTYSPIHPYTHPLTHPLTHLSTHPLTSPIYPLIHPPIPARTMCRNIYLYSCYFKPRLTFLVIQHIPSVHKFPLFSLEYPHNHHVYLLLCESQSKFEDYQLSQLQLHSELVSNLQPFLHLD